MISPLDLNTGCVQVERMARKTITLDQATYERLAAARRPGETFSAAIERMTKVKTNADVLSYYAEKTSWLAPRRIALIEKLRHRKQASLRA